ncbi:MAG TPA: hypothetical protein VFD58_10810 [Blastocatellia bacterium]|nr:hypothetical protein [Blastocatellia bacterium]
MGKRKGKSESPKASKGRKKIIGPIAASDLFISYASDKEETGKSLPSEVTQERAEQAWKAFLDTTLLISNKLSEEHETLPVKENKEVANPASPIRRTPIAGNLFLMLLPAADREVYAGDLAEEFQTWVNQYGLRTAQLYYLKDCVTFAWPIIRFWGKKFAKWITFIAPLLEILRRAMH